MDPDGGRLTKRASPLSRFALDTSRLDRGRDGEGSVMVRLIDVMGRLELEVGPWLK